MDLKVKAGKARLISVRNTLIQKPTCGLSRIRILEYSWTIKPVAVSLKVLGKDKYVFGHYFT